MWKYPTECCMAHTEHNESECHTPDMMESSCSPACYESLEKRLAEIKESWLQLVANADNQAPCDVVVARGDYEVMMSLICGDAYHPVRRLRPAQRRVIYRA